MLIPIEEHPGILRGIDPNRGFCVLANVMQDEELTEEQKWAYLLLLNSLARTIGDTRESGKEPDYTAWLSPMDANLGWVIIVKFGLDQHKFAETFNELDEKLHIIDLAAKVSAPALDFFCVGYRLNIKTEWLHYKRSLKPEGDGEP